MLLYRPFIFLGLGIDFFDTQWIMAAGMRPFLVSETCDDPRETSLALRPFAIDDPGARSYHLTGK